MTRRICWILTFAMIMSFAVISPVFAQDKPAEKPKLLSIDILAGRHLYNVKTCGECHNEGAKEYTPLKGEAKADVIASHSTELELPLALSQPKSKRRQKRVLENESEVIASYLGQRKEADAAKDNLVLAGYLMVQNNCRNCHIINGEGKETAPPLLGVGKRHKREWIIEHFKDPQKFVEDSVMPKFDTLSKEELEAMTDYLMALE